ncbi:MAG: BatA and WFA domain-containing protein [Ignavibacteria bacterium]|nr:BatA and WFA domain-containing protein [Ignavibacteria bacterium]
MTFLNPAILFGLLAASIPILIHLLNLRKLRKIEFSTLIFLKELQKNKIRKIKIKQWLLLLLRVLLILFIVLAFARPTLKGIAIGGTASTAKTTSVFIIDDTFSMGLLNAKGSLLNQSKEIIKTILNNFQEGDEAAFVLVSDLTKEEIKFTTNIIEIQNQLKEIEISSVSGTLNNAFVKAAQMIGQSLNYNKEVYVFSDFQKSRLADEKVFSDMSQFFNENVKLYQFRFNKENVVNYSIDDFSINTKIYEKNKLLNTSAVIHNHSEVDVNNLVISLFINGKRMAQKSVSLIPSESKEIVLETNLTESGYHDLFVEIEDDEMLNDNKRYANIFVPEQFNVLLLSDEKSDSRFLELGIASGSSNDNIKIDNKNITQLNGLDLSKYSAIYITGFDKINQPDILKSYLLQGGGVALFPGSKSDINKLNTFLNSLEIPQLKSYVGTKNNNQTISFRNVDYEHPLFTELFANKNNQKIESPEIYSYYIHSTQGKGKTIIDLFDQSSFLTEYKIGDGKVLLYSVVPDLTSSNFPIKSIFVPLMYKSLLYLSSQQKENVKYITGNKIELQTKSFVTNNAKVIYPDLTEEFISINSELYQNYFPFNNTLQAGNYKFFAGDRLSESISVNIDNRESQTTYLTEDDIVEYLKQINFKGLNSFVDINSDVIQVIQQARYGSELWKLFLILALLTAIIEMFVARNTKKDIAEVSK